MRNTEPHQKCSSRTPPTIGPMALPAENAEIQTATARERWPGSWNMLKMSDRVDGARVAPAMPRAARLAMSISGVVENAASDRQRAERRRADEQQLAPADAVAERAHGHEEAGDHEPVDVDDPEQLAAARLEVLADRRDGQVQDRQVHDVEQAGQGEDAQADPLLATGARPARRRSGRHRGGVMPAPPVVEPRGELVEQLARAALALLDPVEAVEEDAVLGERPGGSRRRRREARGDASDAEMRCPSMVIS